LVAGLKEGDDDRYKHRQILGRIPSRGLSWDTRIVDWHVDVIGPSGRFLRRGVAFTRRFFDGDRWIVWFWWFFNRPIGRNRWLVRW